MRIIWCAIVFFAIFNFGCRNPERGVVQREGKADIVLVKTSDTEMTNAMNEAQRSVREFINVLRSPNQNQSGFSVKYPFEEGETVEHMWVIDLDYDGRVFNGLLNNYPNDIRNFSVGQKVEIEPARISDWMYVEDGRLVGGFTLRVLFKDYSPEKLRDLEESLGFKIE